MSKIERLLNIVRSDDVQRIESARDDVEREDLEPWWSLKPGKYHFYVSVHPDYCWRGFLRACCAGFGRAEPNIAHVLYPRGLHRRGPLFGQAWL